MRISDWSSDVCSSDLDDADLRGRIIGLADIADQPAGRGEVDEAARLLFAKPGRRGLWDIEHAGQIDLDDALPILVAHLVPDGVAQDAGIVDDRVDAAEFGDRILDDARGILRIGDVAEVGDGLAARSDDVGRGRFGRSGVAAVARLRDAGVVDHDGGRSEEHTSELPSLMRISYAVFCLKKKKSER